MDFSNERYVRLYTRDTTTWKLLDWPARAVLMFILRKVDRSGVIDLGDEGVEGLAAQIEVPLEIVAPAVEQLVRRKVLVQTADAAVLPKFIEAQEAVQSEKQRQKESRLRRRDRALDVTKRDAPVTKRDGSVGFRDDPSLQPDQPSRPAFQAEPEKESRALSARADRAPGSLSPLPAGWSPPCGGKAEAAIRKKLGEVGDDQLQRSIAKWRRTRTDQGTSSSDWDADLADWILEERPRKKAKSRGRWDLAADPPLVPDDVPDGEWATVDDEGTWHVFVGRKHEGDILQPSPHEVVRELVLVGRRVLELAPSEAA